MLASTSLDHPPPPSLPYAKSLWYAKHMNTWTTCPCVSRHVFPQHRIWHCCLSLSHTHTHTHACTHMHTHHGTHTHTHTHTPWHTHTHTHTHSPPLSLPKHVCITAYPCACGKPCLKRVQMTAPPRPTLCWRPSLALGTCRLPAIPRICQHSSEHCARPESQNPGTVLITPVLICDLSTQFQALCKTRKPNCRYNSYHSCLDLLLINIALSTVQEVKDKTQVQFFPFLSWSATYQHSSKHCARPESQTAGTTLITWSVTYQHRA